MLAPHRSPVRPGPRPPRRTTARKRLSTSLALDAVGLRVAGAFMLVAGAVLPYLPGWPGLPCPLRTLTGIPCPLCGMSTSVKATLRLQLREAFEANPAGIVAVVVAIALLVVRPVRVRVPPAVLVAGAAAVWLFVLHRFSII